MVKRTGWDIYFVCTRTIRICHVHMAEWSKALCLGRSLRAWVRTPLWTVSDNFAKKVVFVFPPKEYLSFFFS